MADGGFNGGEEEEDEEEEEEEEFENDEEDRLKLARPRVRVPTQPVVTRDEKELFADKYRDKPRFRLPGNMESGGFNINWARMAFEWNRDIRKNHWMNHDSNKILYLKTSSHLREYNSALKRKENADATMAGNAENAGGLSNQSIADKTRDQLRDPKASVKAAALVQLAAPVPNATKQVDAIRPPTSTQQIYPTAYTGRIPQLMPLPETVTIAKTIQTCNRCGGPKSGPAHKHNAKINSPEYCTAFGSF